MVLAAGVATAVLTGALLVGDSVRGSLRDLTLDRLGKIDFALVTRKFFREDLVVDIATSEEFKEQFETIASAILTPGTAVHADSKARASKMNIVAVDAQFFSFFETGNESAYLRKDSGQVFPSIMINQSLQDQLGAEIGHQILLSFEKPSDIARGSLLGRKNTEDAVETVRLTLTKIIPDEGVGRFGLPAHQNLPLNAYVSLPVLQKILDQKDKVNAILVSQRSDSQTAENVDLLQKLLANSLEFEDVGLKFIEIENGFVLESEESILSPQIVKQVKSANEGPLVMPVYTYLANKMSANGRSIPYSTVTALDLSVNASYDSLILLDGSRAPDFFGQEILLNQWAANDLKVQVGDSIDMSYFAVGPRDHLYTKHTKFRVAGIVKIARLGADRHLTPDFPGIADTENMADWNPPFPIDLSLIRTKDEAYWDKYRGTPKAFVDYRTGQMLWGSRFGSITSLRFGIRPGLFDIETEREAFEEKFLANLVPEQFDFVFQPVKAQGLVSSKGATDFSGLFIGFSLFLIVSAALLVGLLFRLGVEQRGREIGMLLAVGFPLRRVRRQFMLEGGLLATLGGLLGTGCAVLYAWLMMVGLRTWWLAAVGSPFLFLHVNPLSLALGFVISLLIVFLSIWIGLRKLSKIPPPALLSGVTTILKEVRAGGKAKATAITTLVLAGILTFLTFLTDSDTAAGLFFGIGTLLLVSGLAFFALWLRGKHGAISSRSGSPVARMAVRNSPRNPGRSMLSTALVGCACFVIFAVEAFRMDFAEGMLKRDSGAGGYALVAQSDVPLFYDLNSEDGRFELGFSDTDSERLKKTEIMPFRFLPGDDASCLNLYQVGKPRIIGVPEDQIQRRGFQFTKTIKTDADDQANPWRLLNMELEPNVIPAFGDANSVQWILHSGLGQDIVIAGEFGEEIKLRFVGLLKKSIFQSELLISEQNFLKYFPSQSGYSYFLVDSPVEEITENAQILERTLTDYGFDVSTTAKKLADFQTVENTYLSTFQTLGGLGLILGTLGLGMILIRNVIERRGELATLRAFGFRKATLALLVLAENGFLLILGILLGAISAVVAIAPHVLENVSQIPWLSLSLTLVVVFLVGMLASLAAVRTAIKIPLLPALKAE